MGRVIVVVNGDGVAVAIVASDVTPVQCTAEDQEREQRRDGATKKTIMDDPEHPFGL